MQIIIMQIIIIIIITAIIAYYRKWRRRMSLAPNYNNNGIPLSNCSGWYGHSDELARGSTRFDLAIFTFSGWIRQIFTQQHSWSYLHFLRHSECNSCVRPSYKNSSSSNVSKFYADILLSRGLATASLWWYHIGVRSCNIRLDVLFCPTQQFL
jgi:hypothetical protein